MALNQNKKVPLRLGSSLRDNQDIIQTAHAMAEAGARAVRPYFRSASLAADNKAVDGFDPVTEGDRAVERAMRSVLAERRPEDAIRGEEYGVQSGTSGLTWVLDPIDGTRAFLIGAPTWGILIAACDDDGPILGLIVQPHTGETWIGGLGACELVSSTGKFPLRTRAARPLNAALLCSTFPEIGSSEEHTAFTRVAQQVRLVRYGLDCYAYGLLASGHIDLVIEAGLQDYDICSPAAVVSAAGGVVTTWSGDAPHKGGRIIAAANPDIHAEALALLQASRYSGMRNT